MAINQILLSFSDQLKKSRNPFFGTFIVVWIIRNWQFLVTLFNLDLYPTMDQKLKALERYFVDDNLIRSFFVTAAITLIVLIVSYVLLNITRLITNYFERGVTPWVYKISDVSNIVLKSEYGKLEAEKEQIESRLSEERVRRIKAEEERDRLERANLEKAQSQVKTESATAEVLRHDSGFSGTGEEEKLMDRIHSHLTADEQAAFIAIAIRIQRQEWLSPKDTLVDKLSGLRLIEIDPDPRKIVNNTSDSAKYRLSSIGDLYWNYVNLRRARASPSF